MKKALILPFAVLSALGLVTVASCGGNSSSSVPSSEQPSSSEVKSSESVSSSSELVVENLEIANLEALMADWHLGDSPRTIDLNITPEINVLDALNKGILKVTSSDPSVVAVNGLGISALKVGEAMIRVEVGSKTLSFSVNVLPVKTYQSVAATLEEVKDLAAGETKNNILTKGVVTKIPSSGVWSDKYKNITLYIGDEGAGNELECYRAVVAEGIDGSKIKVGDTISITGNVTNYQGTLEYAANSVITEVIPGKDVEPEKPAVKTIAEIEDNRKVELSGVTVVAKNARAIVVSDGTNSVYVYANEDLEVAIGDVVNVAGLGSLYHNGYLQIGSPTVTKVETGTPVTVTPVAATKEIVDGWKTGKFSFAESKPYTWTTTVGKSGNYLTTPFEGSETLIEPAYAAEGLIEQGKEYEITAYFVGYDVKYGYACVVIMSVAPVVHTYEPESIELSATASSLKVGNNLDIAATLGRADGQTVTETGLTWASSNEEIATVDANGKVTGVKEGDVTITATSTAVTTLSKTIDLTVTPAVAITAVSEITGAKTLALNDKKGVQLSIEVTYENDSKDSSVTWSSSDSTILTVDASGLVKLGESAAPGSKATISAVTTGKGNDNKQITKTVEIAVGYTDLSTVAYGDTVDVIGKVMLKDSKNENIFIDDGNLGALVYTKNGFTLDGLEVGKVIHIEGTVGSYSGQYQIVPAVDDTEAVKVSIVNTDVTPTTVKALTAEDAETMFKGYKDDGKVVPWNGLLSLTTDFVGESGSYLTWKLGDTNMESTKYSNLTGMTAGKRYALEGYVANVYSGQYLCFNITKATELTNYIKAELDTSRIEVEGFANITAQTLNVPEGSETPAITYSSSDEKIATVDENGKIKGVAAGEAVITVSNGVGDPVQLTVEVVEPRTYTSVASYNMVYDLGTKTSAVDITEAEKLAPIFSLNTGKEIIKEFSNLNKVYGGANGGGSGNTWVTGDVLKLGTSSANGSLTITLTEKVGKVVITGYGWKATHTADVNGVTSDGFKANLANKANVEAENTATVEFFLKEDSDEITITSIGTSLVITAIEFLA